MVGDWVAPNGKGISTDIIFTGKLDKKDRNDFDYKLTISFRKPTMAFRNLLCRMRKRERLALASRSPGKWLSDQRGQNHEPPSWTRGEG